MKVEFLKKFSKDLDGVTLKSAKVNCKLPLSSASKIRVSYFTNLLKLKVPPQTASCGYVCL